MQYCSVASRLGTLGAAPSLAEDPGAAPFPGLSWGEARSCLLLSAAAGPGPGNSGTAGLGQHRPESAAEPGLCPAPLGQEGRIHTGSFPAPLCTEGRDGAGEG